MNFNKEEKDILDELKQLTHRRIIQVPSNKYTVTEWIIINEEKAEHIEDDFLNGIIDRRTANQLEIENSSFYVELEQVPSDTYTLEERKELVRLYWKWVLGKDSEEEYRQKCINGSFLQLTIHKNSGQEKEVFK